MKFIDVLLLVIIVGTAVFVIWYIRRRRKKKGVCDACASCGNCPYAASCSDKKKE